jgi:CubicO group peptidase (beta-lactamase class C family)
VIKRYLPVSQMPLFVLVFFALFQISCSGKDEPVGPQIDRIFAEYKRTDEPGCAIAVVQNGKVVYQNGYGSANLEYNIPITPATVFDIASVSKQFAGVAIATLVQKGKISLDDDIRKYLPDVPEFSKTITVRHLVHHTSGIRDWPEALRVAGWRWDDVISFEDIMRMVKYQRDLDFEPGSQYSYSNTGYNLLAAIVEKVSGKQFSQWTTDEIFEPLGMKSSWFQDDYKRPVKNLAYSYAQKDKGFEKVTGSLTAYGSSSLFTTVEDLSKWVIHFDKQIADKNPVYTSMLQSGTLSNGQKIDYAFGLSRGEDRGIKTVAHTGGWQGYRTILINYPDEKLSIILLSNSAEFNISKFSGEVADLFLKDKWKVKKGEVVEDKVKKLATVKIDTALIRKMTGTYQLGPGWTVALTLENGELMVQAIGEPKFPTQTKSDSVVWIDAYSASMTLLKDSTGAFNALRYKNIIAKRIETHSANPVTFGQFAGNYYSPELFTQYQVEMRGGKLTMHHIRNGDFELTPDPSGTDQFKSDFGQIKFVRDNGQKVTGLTFSGGRIKNIRFNKQ